MTGRPLIRRAPVDEIAKVKSFEYSCELRQTFCLWLMEKKIAGTYQVELLLRLLGT